MCSYWLYMKVVGQSTWCSTLQHRNQDCYLMEVFSTDDVRSARKRKIGSTAISSLDSNLARRNTSFFEKERTRDSRDVFSSSTEQLKEEDGSCRGTPESSLLLSFTVFEAIKHWWTECMMCDMYHYNLGKVIDRVSHYPDRSLLQQLMIGEDR